MQTEDKIFGLIAQAEDIQKHAVTLQRAAQEVLKTLPDASKSAIREAARESIVQGAEEASRSLWDASSAAEATASTLRRTGIFQCVFLVAVAIVVAGIGYGVSSWIFRSRGDDLAELKTQIVQEQATLDALRSKTWGLELVDYKDGTRGIVLPKNVKIDRTGDMPDGRAAVVIRP